MEPEKKSNKRGLDVADDADDVAMAVRTSRNPFYVQRSTGLVLFDAHALSQPEHQALLRALYEHYQRGGSAPLPFEIFPLRQVPEELLLQLVNGDVRTFLNLSSSTPLMKARLKPLTARFVCETWPDVALVLAMACDLNLIQQLERLNAAFPKADGGDLMGFGVTTERHHRSGSIDNLQTKFTKAVREQRPSMVNSLLRDMYYDPDGKYYLILTGDKNHELYSKFGGAGFTLPFAEKCRYSNIAAIKLIAEVMERCQQLGLRWRYNESHHDLKGIYHARKAEFNDFGSLPDELSKWTMTEMPGRERHPNAYEKIRIFTMELCDALIGDPAQATAPTPTMFEFEGVAMVPEAEGFSVDAAHFRTMLERYEREVEVLLAQKGAADPLFTEIIPVDVLANQVCLMAGATDCGAFWSGLLREVSKLLMSGMAYERRQGRPDKGRPPGFGEFHSDAPYRCTECHATATRCDTTFRLPFCAQQDCLRATFAKLHKHGLWHGQLQAVQ